MDIATTLLEYGAATNAESKAGFTPLHLSAQEGHTDMSTLLIEHSADANYAAKNGLTPLHLCAQEDRVSVAAILVKNNAEINVQTKVTRPVRQSVYIFSKISLECRADTLRCT